MPEPQFQFRTGAGVVLVIGNPGYEKSHLDYPSPFPVIPPSMSAMYESSSTWVKPRNRRTHRKSRTGCGNCKLRRVKCDEGSPECKKCLHFGVVCNYDVNSPDLKPRYSMSQRMNGRVQTYRSLDARLASAEESTLELTEGNLSRLERFHMRTVFSIGPPQLRRIYQDEVYQLVFGQPLMMHTVQCLTAIHDRYLSTTPARQSTDEIYHWTKGVVLLNKKLSIPLHPADRDALWGAATMLGVISFASIEGGTPEDVWPLNSIAGAEPGWLKMCYGKVALWQLVNPERQDSIFHGLFSGKDSIIQYIPPLLSSIGRVPAPFIELYGLDKASADGNPYALPVISIAAILNNESAISTIQLYYAFTSCVTNEFGNLVLNRDPRSLLIMAFWYSNLSMGEWWLRKRALLEGQATCLYLERYASDNTAIQEHLKVPKNQLFKDRTAINVET